MKMKVCPSVVLFLVAFAMGRLPLSILLTFDSHLCSHSRVHDSRLVLTTQCSPENPEASIAAVWVPFSILRSTSPDVLKCPKSYNSLPFSLGLHLTSCDQAPCRVEGVRPGEGILTGTHLAGHTRCSTPAVFLGFSWIFNGPSPRLFHSSFFFSPSFSPHLVSS